MPSSRKSRTDPKHQPKILNAIRSKDIKAYEMEVDGYDRSWEEVKILEALIPSNLAPDNKNLTTAEGRIGGEFINNLRSYTQLLDMELHFVCSLQLAKKLPFLIECSF